MVSNRTLAGTAIFTAFVAAATSAFSVYIPATTGYFNVGEIMVYTSALLMGPYVGAFAGGVGSAISDLSLGFSYYAPGTLLIKGAEGFVVGYLSTRVFQNIRKPTWRMITVLLGLMLAVFLAYVGTTYLSGDFSITLGGAWYIPAWSTDFFVSPFVWIVIGALVFGIMAFMGLRVEARSGKNIMSVLTGGLVMVSGYYAYESFVLTLIAPASVVATLFPAAEIPFNVAQALIGLLVAVPLVRSIRRVMRRTPLKLGDLSSPADGASI